MGATYPPTWMDWPMLYTGNPQILGPGMVFFLHMIVLNSRTGLSMCLGETSIVTARGSKPSRIRHPSSSGTEGMKRRAARIAGHRDRGARLTSRPKLLPRRHPKDASVESAQEGRLPGCLHDEVPAQSRGAEVDALRFTAGTVP